jgi:ATP-dependent DNA helicase PIF1
MSNSLLLSGTQTLSSNSSRAPPIESSPESRPAPKAPWNPEAVLQSRPLETGSPKRITVHDIFQGPGKRFRFEINTPTMVELLHEDMYETQVPGYSPAWPIAPQDMSKTSQSTDSVESSCLKLLPPALGHESPEHPVHYSEAWSLAQNLPPERDSEKPAVSPDHGLRNSKALAGSAICGSGNTEPQAASLAAVNSDQPTLRLPSEHPKAQTIQEEGIKSHLSDEPIDLTSSPPSPGTQSQRPKTPVPSEPVLCQEQADLVELVASGRNVFYTGSAGCGKSTVLKAITKRLQEGKKQVRIVAPTGRAALQVNGSTTWTFAGWTPDHHKRPLDELCQAAHGKFVWKRLNETDVLIIDEISMVENLHFERLNAFMKAARFNPKLKVQPAFGGVQLIVTGDFCQLPPVRPFQHCIQCGRELVEGSSDSGLSYNCARHGGYRDEDKWTFKSAAWDECNFEHVQLKTIHRQSDETFIRILQKCRMGSRLTSEETDLLMDHECMVHHATKLFATRAEVDKINEAEFTRLKGLNHIFWCYDNFFWQQDLHRNLQWKGMRKPKGPQSEGPLKSLEDHRFAECVQLKKGMLVVLLVNLDLASGLCNGSQGIICGFEKNDPKKLPRAKKTNKDEPENPIFGDRALMKQQQIKAFIDDTGAKYKVWPVVRFHNGLVRTIYADCSISELGDDKPYSLLCRTQIPLAPAWAMTIHKSQSLTLDRVIVNLSKAFEKGQVYVALSRATSLKGLKIEGDRAGLLAGLGGNKEVQEFLRNSFR